MNQQQIYSKPVLTFMAAGSGRGKTTILTQVLPILQAMGLKIGIIKHACHIHLPDTKDSTKYHNLATGPVTVTGGGNLLLTNKAELTLGQIIDKYYKDEDVDLIIAEGYKNSNLPKIEIVRREISCELHAAAHELICVVTDAPEMMPEEITTVAIDDFQKLAEIIYSWYTKQAK